MPNISDRELDKLFQEAGHEIRPEFDPHDWNDMAKRLDKAKRRAVFYRASGYGLAVLLLISTAAWLTDSGTTTRRLAETQPSAQHGEATDTPAQQLNTTATETTTAKEPDKNTLSASDASTAMTATTAGKASRAANTRTHATESTAVATTEQKLPTSQTAQRDDSNSAVTAYAADHTNGAHHTIGTLQKQQPLAAGRTVPHKKAAKQRSETAADASHNAAQTGSDVTYAKADGGKHIANINHSEDTADTADGQGPAKAGNTHHANATEDGATANHRQGKHAITPTAGVAGLADTQRATVDIKSPGSEKNNVNGQPTVQQQNIGVQQASQTTGANTQHGESNNRSATSADDAVTAAAAGTASKQNTSAVTQQADRNGDIAIQDDTTGTAGQPLTNRAHYHTGSTTGIQQADAAQDSATLYSNRGNGNRQPQAAIIVTQSDNKAVAGDTENNRGVEASYGNAQPHSTTAGDSVANALRNQTPENARHTYAQQDVKKNNGLLMAGHIDTAGVALAKPSDAKESRSAASVNNNTASTLQPADSVATPERDSVKTVDTKAATDSTHDATAEAKKKSKTPAKWFLKLPVSPDFSSINYGKPGKLGINAGLIAEFMPGKHWSVSLGAIWSKKLYTWDNPEKTYSGGPYGGAAKASFLDGDCRVIDIPFNITYYLRPEARTNYFITVGVSSYIMLKEDYTYTVWANQQEYQYNEKYVGENKNWLSMLNLSIGIQHRLSNRFQVQAEPFLKAPLSGVGQGKVNLVSMGAFFTLKFQLTK